MLSLSVTDKELLIKDISKDQLREINEWLKDTECYKYAMGTDQPITIDDLYEKYLEVLVNAHEFFLGISTFENFIGFIRGRVDYHGEGEIWIMSMLIDVSYQNKGIGTRVLDLVMNEFKEKLGITKFYTCLVDDNITGRSFWESNCFSPHRFTKGYFTIENKSCDLVIMIRNI